jgi:D-aspartate ligase
MRKKLLQGDLTILVIDDNSPFTLPLLRSFSDYRDIRLHVLVSTGRKYIPYRHSRYLQGLHRVKRLDEANFEELMRETIRASGAGILIPTREWISELLYRHRESLGRLAKIHPLPDPATLAITGNKWELNTWLHENGFPFATSVRLDEGWTGPFPVLLKPVEGIGGEGIVSIADEEILGSWQVKLGKGRKDLFLQERVPGYDIDISLFASEGKILFHTIQRGMEHESLSYSRGIEFIRDESLYGHAERIIRLLNFTGIAHLDFRYNEEKQEHVLIDFNSRYWSSLQGSRAMGVNFPALVVAYAFGELKEYPEYREGNFFFTTMAFQTILRNLFSRKKKKVRLKQSQLEYLYRDPVPELQYLLRSLLGR